MKVCPNCGYCDNPLWRHSRFDYNADYMRFDEAKKEDELKQVCFQLQGQPNFTPITVGEIVYYRRGTGGIYLYRVVKEDYRIRRERKKHEKTREVKH